MVTKNIPTYIDPISDFGFKRIFGTEPNKDLLIAFLNVLFRGRKSISDIVFVSTEKVGDASSIGTVIFDLLCRGNNQEQFIIEVQKSKQEYLKKRILYYAAKLTTDQAPKGNRQSWKYDFHEVYVIVLMEGFTISDANPTGLYLHDVCLCDRNTGKIFQEDIGFIYLELANFTKEEADLQDDLDNWLYVLKNMSQLNRIPIYLRKPIFEKLFNIAQYSTLSKEDKHMYDIKLKRKWDEKAVMDYATNSGIQKGIEIGEEKGRMEGKIEGRMESKLEIALKMKKTGFSDAEIHKYTGLSIEEINKLN